jgi:hypothetical protein
MSITLIAAFGLGYVTYPLINPSNQQKTPNNAVAEVSEQAQSDNAFTLAATSNSDQNKLPNTSAQASQTVNQAIEQSAEPKTIPNEIVQLESGNKGYQQKELTQWVVEHKSNLEQLVKTHFPDDIVDIFQIKIDENNTVFNEPEMKQDEQKDENWAYIKEQDIRAIYEQQKNLIEVELINVTCKQLACDMLGTAKGVSEWMKAYTALYSLPDVMFPDDSPKKAVHVSFTKEDKSYSYSQIFFKEPG